MRRDSPASFSRLQRWSLSLNLALSTLAILALVLMVNYLAARHFRRFAVADRAQTQFAPITRRVIDSVTNQVKVIIYFDKRDPLYDSVWSLLKEYKFANPRIAIETVDYFLDPGTAELIKSKYQLGKADKDLIIFDSNGITAQISEGELSEFDVQPFVSGQSKTIKRTHFKGEMLFTSALQRVVHPRALKAYFLQGDGEHLPDSDEKTRGYSALRAILKQNNVTNETLTLRGAGEIPPDCNLLIIAGPTTPLLGSAVEKIQHYLEHGGRLLVLFRYQSLDRATGLEKMLEQWGVSVGRDLVIDRDNSQPQSDGNDVLVYKFGNHPIVKPIDTSIYLFLPRSISKIQNGTAQADAPQVELLAFTGPNGRVVNDIRSDSGGRGPVPHENPSDFRGAVPLIAAVEKGTIRDVSADRGSTRIVVAGDSFFLSNGVIENAANREFASFAINWLLARNELLIGLAPRPIKEYRIMMGQSQQRTVSWLLLGAMPGGVLLMGTFVWFRRRK